MVAKAKDNTQEKIDALTTHYRERLEARVAEGKDLPGSGTRRRVPLNVAEENVDAYVELRGQLQKLKELRRDSVSKLREIKEQMESLRTGKKVTRKKKVAKQ